jgi:hypothetical protein
MRAELKSADLAAGPLATGAIRMPVRAIKTLVIARQDMGNGAFDIVILPQKTGKPILARRCPL